MNEQLRGLASLIPSPGRGATAPPVDSRATETDGFWNLPLLDVLSSLGSSAQGLASAEAERRLAQHGPNTLAADTSGHIVRLLLRQFGSPIVLLLVAAAFLSLLLHDPSDAAIILVIVAVSGLLGFWQRSTTRTHRGDMLSTVELKAVVIRDGKRNAGPVSAVVPGGLRLRVRRIRHLRQIPVSSTRATSS